MDKKQRISWGVSFGSLALVAGMVSYLGLSNGNNNQTAVSQNSPANQNTNQQVQNNLDSSGNQSSGDSNSSSNFSFDDDQASQYEQGNSDDSFQQNQAQFSGGGHSFGHHDGFDTTTGGT
ncbi:hypothetical protein ABE288_12520 [Bacillus salipaludis]|uniref:hypothetical protein n=1 Tax=Bacillus salipaludis TaxID=2547811 RepID=UPI003D20C69D